MVGLIPQKPNYSSPVYSVLSPHLYSLPVTNMFVNNKSITALCDSGSAINLLSSAMLSFFFFFFGEYHRGVL